MKDPVKPEAPKKEPTMYERAKARIAEMQAKLPAGRRLKFLKVRPQERDAILASMPAEERKSAMGTFTTSWGEKLECDDGRIGDVRFIVLPLGGDL